MGASDATPGVSAKVATLFYVLLDIFDPSSEVFYITGDICIEII